jgi:hypothetical protein
MRYSKETVSCSSGFAFPSAMLIAAGLSWSAFPAHPAYAQLGFTEFALPDTSLNSSPSTDFWIASAAPADVHSDGDPDLLIPSSVSGWEYSPAAVLRNDGPGAGGDWVFTDAAAGLPVTPNAVSAWADMEGDGDLDLLLANVTPYGGNFVETFRNTAGAFASADTGLAHIRYGMADWGDADNDGDLDVVYAGNIDLPDGTGETVVRILFFDGETGYVPFDVVHDFQSPQEPWLDFTAVSWADYDSDGDIDLLVSGEWLGEGEIFGRSVVYANNAGTFALASEPLPAPIVGNAGGAFTWFDVDGDDDLDYFVAGGYYVLNGGGLIEARAQLFRNDAISPNAAPSAPSTLVALPAGNDVALSWNAATDDRTPQGALTYELNVAPSGTPSASGKAIPEPGNVSRNTSWILRGLDPGAYVWSVRALDNAFNGGPRTQGTFVVGTVPAPAPGARALVLTAPSPNPSRPVAWFTLVVDREQSVTVAVFDAGGRLVEVLHEGVLAAGSHMMRLDSSGLASGTYFVRATAGSMTSVQPVTILR